MSEQVIAPTEDAYTPSQLRSLPRAERNAVLARAAAEAAHEYRTDRELTDFEAFGEDDLYGESTDSEAR